jgi:hypothetical protein
LVVDCFTSSSHINTKCGAAIYKREQCFTVIVLDPFSRTRTKRGVIAGQVCKGLQENCKGEHLLRAGILVALFPLFQWQEGVSRIRV